MAQSPCTELSAADQLALLRLARQAIAGELGIHSTGRGDDHDGGLTLKRGVFVTLTRDGALRGCIGTFESDRALMHSVPECALGAAFRDPRFPALAHAELDEVRVEISVLTDPELMATGSREDLLLELRPGVDGLLIEEAHQRATFLPQVWEQLADPEDFLSHLMRKAGLPGDYWSGRLRCSRYQCIKFTEADQPPA